jgi:hypothetical protein
MSHSTVDSSFQQQPQEEMPQYRYRWKMYHLSVVMHFLRQSSPFRLVDSASFLQELEGHLQSTLEDDKVLFRWFNDWFAYNACIEKENSEL